MAPNKLENQVQEKLNSREIQPSAQAWDRLDAMLTIAEQKKTKRPPFLSFRYIGIAASFLVFLAIGKLVYDQNSNPEVSGEIPNSKNQPAIVNSNPEVSGEIPTNKFQNPTAIQVIAQNQQTATKNLQSKRVSIINQNQNNQIVEVITKKQEDPQPIISQEVVVSNQKNVVTEVEIPTQQQTPVTKIKVNATSLLSQVDGELNQTYRETKLEKIARNFNTVKVALTNRNNQ
jgi:hypothetical protein